jgi:hypothetical protein
MRMPLFLIGQREKGESDLKSVEGKWKSGGRG